MSSNTDNPLNTNDGLSDDEDLFVSTYTEPAQSKTTSNKDQLGDNDVGGGDKDGGDQAKIPQPPPRKQSQPSIDTSNLESEMNTIDLNDDEKPEKDESVVVNSENEKQESNEPVNMENSSESVTSSSNENKMDDHRPVITRPVDPTELKTSNQTTTTTATAAKVVPAKPLINTASQISITVSDPQKMGEGMGSYMVYTVHTRTTLPYFRRQSMSVNRRFSDFLGLHSKLLMKHGPNGRIVPPPPAKSAVGTAKVKMAKDDSLHSMDFIAKRRAALERYLQRNAEHPVLCSDPDFREFLELDTELPRSTSTSALSGAGVKRLFNFFGDTVQKMTFRMEESDPWFESKQQQIEILDSQLRKLQAAVDSLIYHRKELTNSLEFLGKSTALIGHDESNVSLSCALSHLAATHEKVEKIYENQANKDFLYLSELLRDYIAMIGAVRDAFHERVKCFQNLSTLEQALNRKRESKAKMELSMKNEKVPQIDEEIRDLQDKVEKAKDDFEKISDTFKQEFDRFDINRIRDFKNNFLKYMESLLETQESLIECWETFLPEAKSISA